MAAIVHEAAWKQFNSHPFIWGTFAWNMFDFCVAQRREGGSVALNDKGLVTFDRKSKKDAFYFYKANWSDEPVLHINSSRFTERTNAVTDVKIYSNAKTAELFINGASQGTCYNDGNDVFVWKDTKLVTGENHVEAKANTPVRPLKIVATGSSIERIPNGCHLKRLSHAQGQRIQAPRLQPLGASARLQSFPVWRRTFIGA